MARKKKINKRKTAIYIFIGLIIIAIILGSKLGKLERIKNENINIVNENKIENKIENETNENIVEENNNILTTSNTPTTQEQISSEEKTVENLEKERTNKERAIEYVKNNWGEDDSVEFRIDEHSEKDENGNYIVEIRNKNNTYLIDKCIVDIETGTCTFLYSY